MSALAGFWRFDGKPQPGADCARMLAAQRIYGPHDERQWCDGSLAMGRRLFCLLPEDIYDRQPLHSRDGRLTLVADVRIDNREDLAAKLGLSLTDVRLFSDAAILLQSLDFWGEDALDHIVGDFAFALWDAAAQRLLLARDFIGQRPLHYHRCRNFFAFASMPKGLHALAEVPYGPDEQTIAEFLVLMPRRGSRSFFRDIARVEPGHIVTVTPDRLTSRRYWHPQRPTGGRLRSRDYIEGVRHHLNQATQSRLRGANGIVGSHLSAGLDSSAVTATAARLLAPVGGKVIAFTAAPREGYDDRPISGGFADEGPLAAATAAVYANVEHVLIRPDSLSPLDDLDRAFHLFERPILNPCTRVWLNAINRAAAQRKLTVVLEGSMGNMSASYHGLPLLPELLLAARFTSLWRASRHLVENAGMSPRGVFIQILGPFMPAWLWRLVERRVRGSASDVLSYTAIRAGHLAGLKLADLARERNLDFSYRPWKDGFAMRLWVMSRFEFADARKGTLAGWGIDYRDPLSDRRLVEYCLRIPTREYLFNGVPRALARRAFADRLPATVLNERKQGYQAADWHEGMSAARKQIVEELGRLSECESAAKALDVERMKRLVDHWPTSGWERVDVIDNYRCALLRGISVGHFLRRVSGTN